MNTGLDDRGAFLSMAIWVKRGRKLVDLFLEMEKGAVLDIPSGKGQEAAHLLRLGYRVVAADLFPSRAENPNFPWVTADANASFPFRDAAFDYVLSREGIEHFENQAGFLRECGRVLKPGGKLVLTTPNVMHLGSRLSHFLIGQRTLRRGLANEIQTLRKKEGNDLYHGHIFLLDYFRLRYLLRLSEFDRIKIFTDRYSPTSIALAGVVPLLFAASKLSIKMGGRAGRKKGRKSSPMPVLNQILEHLFSGALLFGKRMIVLAEKSV
jgi:SAM-dependent methyltransferase